MALVVFLRGANLGNRRFKPAQLAQTLADLDVTNLGAAGTFVVRKKVAERTLRAKLQAEIPFDAPMVVCTEKEVLAALEAGATVDAPEGTRRFATAMEKAPSPAPKLPLTAPAGSAWAVRVALLEGRFAIGTRRPAGETGVYPNEVVEKAFKVSATTRDWPTMEKLGKLLEKG